MAPLSFLTLPWDNRRKIYAAVEDGGLRLRHRNLDIVCNRNLPGAIPASAVLSLGSVCLQIRDEVWDHFFADNVFRYDSWEAKCAFKQHCPKIARCVQDWAAIPFVPSGNQYRLQVCWSKQVIETASRNMKMYQDDVVR